MGVDQDQCRVVFINPDMYVQNEFTLYWGWWKVQILGFYAFTDLRDYHVSEQSGVGRPWLSLLDSKYQELIFRELVLLIRDWNRSTQKHHQVNYNTGEPLPRWAYRWLSLTNESWTKGIAEAERDFYEAVSESAQLSATDFVERYKRSSGTWRPMMPKNAAFHRAYGSRDVYWSFDH